MWGTQNNLSIKGDLYQKPFRWTKLEEKVWCRDNKKTKGKRQHDMDFIGISTTNLMRATTAYYFNKRTDRNSPQKRRIRIWRRGSWRSRRGTCTRRCPPWRARRGSTCAGRSAWWVGGSASCWGHKSYTYLHVIKWIQHILLGSFCVKEQQNSIYPYKIHHL